MLADSDILQVWVSGLFWLILWALGGYWLARACFNLRKNEQLLVGLSVGLVLQAWLANLIVPWLSVIPAFWLAAFLTFLIGGGLLIQKEGLSALKHFEWFNPWQTLGFFFLVYLFFVIGRGMAISDDFQNLPLAAMLAVGDIPLHFPLDPAVLYPYHYLNLLVSAQFMRLFHLFTWTGVDMARALSFALAVFLAGLWGQRLTRSALAGYLNGLVFALAGGSRWLMLLLPTGILTNLSAHIQMIGSGKASAPDLLTALQGTWATSGAGPYPFPFAYVNGFVPPMILNYHSGAGAFGVLITWIILLTHNRQRNWGGWALQAVLLAASALASETGLVLYCLGMGILWLVEIIKRRSLWPSLKVRYWLAVFVAAGLISLFQGGVLTDTLTTWLARLQGQTVASYHSFNFSFLFPPAIISGHLGQLSLFDPYQLLAVLIEIGPLILAVPLMTWWGFKAFRSERLFEALLVLSSLLGLPFIFVQFSGEAGPTAMIRIQAAPFGETVLVILPVLWLWAARFSKQVKIVLASLFLPSLTAGAVLLAIQLIAIPLPVNSFYINDLDARASQDYWDKLPKDALVLDSNPTRVPILFGRFTDAGIDYFKAKPEWEKLISTADPYQWRAHGFTYAYLDKTYFKSLSPEQAQKLQQASCMQLVNEYTQTNPVDFRRLYDLNRCQ